MKQFIPHLVMIFSITFCKKFFLFSAPHNNWASLPISAAITHKPSLYVQMTVRQLSSSSSILDKNLIILIDNIV